MVAWSVNGKTVSTGTETRFCSENYVRDDRVTVTVGTSDVGGSTTVSIGNSLPRMVDISSTPEEIFPGGNEVTVTPVAEDDDGDDVDFTYQWLVNGEPDPQLTDATLPAGSFTKGDSIQVQIIPNDFYEDGPSLYKLCHDRSQCSARYYITATARGRVTQV